MIFSKLLLIKVNIIHIRFAPACPHRRIRQSLHPTTQYAHSHSRHLANLAPHASYSCSIKQADSACPHARPARLTSQQYFVFSSPRNIYRTHTPASFILLRFCPIPCAARFIAQCVIHFCPSHFPPHLRFPKNARTVRLAALTISLSHICPFSCAPSKAIRQRPLPHTPVHLLHTSAPFATRLPHHALSQLSFLTTASVPPRPHYSRAPPVFPISQLPFPAPQKTSHASASHASRLSESPDFHPGAPLPARRSRHSKKRNLVCPALLCSASRRFDLISIVYIVCQNGAYSAQTVPNDSG